MPRRHPQPRTLPGDGLARHRWSASLGRAEISGDQKGLLDVPGHVEPRHDGSGGSAPAAFRWRTGRGAAALLAVISLLLGGWFWWQAAAGAPRVQPLAEPPGAGQGSLGAAGSPAGGPGPAAASSGPPAADGAAPDAGDPAGPGTPGTQGTTAAERIMVHVAGAVTKPGVVALPAGSRLHEAITAAGGSTGAADLDRLNLAAVLEDGQKVLVPEQGSPDAVDPAPTSLGGSAATGTGGSTGPPIRKVNLNTAGVEELATLPRVGPVLAQRIVDWRREHGRFGSVEELDAVEGVGPKLLEALLPLVAI